MTSGKRPPLKYIKYEDQKELVKKCWCDNPEERYSFEEIFEYLKNHRNILHSTIDEQEIENYLQRFNEQTSIEIKNSEDLFI